MDTIRRIRDLMKAKNWSEYKLAKESGLSQSTISNIFSRNSIPSIPTLETICFTFGITLAQFFTENEQEVLLKEEQIDLFEKWMALTVDEKKVIEELIYILSKK